MKPKFPLRKTKDSNTGPFEKLDSLRQKLYQKAKQEPQFRFYALYDRIYRPDTLAAAWQQVRSNKGAAGIDGLTLEQIESNPEGPQQLLEQLHQELREKTYKPQAIKRVYIPKANGGERPLGIPCVRDRIAQTATLLILEPIFEADFLDCSYGFRPERNAHQALEEVRQELKGGRTEVYDADLQGYFDTIPHDKLLQGIQTRVTDGSVLQLIRMWLNAPIVEGKEKGNPRVFKAGGGVPQGGCLSPLLANSYLHWFDKAFHGKKGPTTWAKAKLVRYADDFVIIARYITTNIVRWAKEILETRLGLTIHPEKTAIHRLREEGESLDFLGYTYRFEKDLYGGEHSYLSMHPSKKAVGGEREKLRELINVRNSFTPLPQLIARINRQVQGWGQYFSKGYARREHRRINKFMSERLGRHLKRRSQRAFRLPGGMKLHDWLERMGLKWL